MATRYSGKLRISAVLDDRTGNYRVGVTDGKHRWRGSVGAPASGFGAGIGYDSPAAYDSVAHAALSFASDEADWVAEQAYMTDSGWHIGRSENEKWMPAKRRSSRDPASRGKSRGRPSRTARKPARAPRRRRDEEKSLAERFASLADYAVGVRDKLQQLGLTASEARRAADEWWGLIQEGWETAKSTLSVARTILGFFRGNARRDRSRSKTGRAASRDVGGWLRRKYAQAKESYATAKTRLAEDRPTTFARRIAEEMAGGYDFQPGEIARRFRISKAADAAIQRMIEREAERVSRGASEDERPSRVWAVYSDVEHNVPLIREEILRHPSSAERGSASRAERGSANSRDRSRNTRRAMGRRS